MYRRLALAGTMALAVAACAAPQPAPPKGPPLLLHPEAPPIPVPAADSPDAFNYLPEILLDCPGDERAFFKGLAALPFEDVRYLYIVLGLVQNRTLYRATQGPENQRGVRDQGEDAALGRRMHLYAHWDFSTAAGARHVYQFFRESPAGAAMLARDGIPRSCLLIMTDDAFHPIAVTNTPQIMIEPLVPEATDGALTITFSPENRGGMRLMPALQSIRCTANAIEIHEE